MVYKSTSSKKVCGVLGCRWLKFKSKKEIPIEEDLKRMMLRKGGSLPDNKVKELKEIIEYIKKNGFDAKVQRRIKKLERYLKF